MSSRGSIGPVRVSSRASSIAKPNDSPYYIGLDKVSEDTYHRFDNPDGIIQLGLSENRVSFLDVYLIFKKLLLLLYFGGLGLC